MPREEYHFGEVWVDLVEKWPASESFIAIVVITYWLDKAQHNIVANTTWIVTVVANTHINKIWRLCGLPRFRLLSTIYLKVPQRSKPKAKYPSMAFYNPPPTCKGTQQGSSTDTEAVPAPPLALESQVVGSLTAFCQIHPWYCRHHYRQTISQQNCLCLHSTHHTLQ